MKNQIIEQLQERTKDIIFNAINHNRLDTSLLTEDATWFVGTGFTNLKVMEIQQYLEHNAIENTSETPEIKFALSDFMGSECVSLVGEVDYHSDVNSEIEINVELHANWVLAQEEWKLKQLITVSTHTDTRTINQYANTQIDSQLLVESIPTGIICCSWDELLSVQHINEHALEIMGYDSITDYKNFAGNSIIASIHPEEINKFRDYIYSVQSSDFSDMVHIRLRKKDFSYIYVHMSAMITEEKWIVITCQDHTDYHLRVENIKSEKEKLEELQETYRTIINNMPSGFHRCTLFDPVHMEYVSDSFCKMTGYSRQEIQEDLQSLYINLVVPEDRQIIIDSITALMEYPHTKQMVYHIQKKDGSAIKVLDKIRSVRHSDGKMWAYSIVVKIEDDTINGESIDVETTTEQQHVTANNHRVDIHTFGYFEVLINNKPIAFRSGKARELLAILADRRGNFVSREAIITSLWEDETVNPTTLSRCRKVFKNLSDELKEYGIEDIVESKNGMRRLVSEKVHCDLIDYLNGAPDAKYLFNGAYLNEYSWGETTLVHLLTYDDKLYNDGPTSSNNLI